jgi:hypothetical protein
VDQPAQGRADQRIQKLLIVLTTVDRDLLLRRMPITGNIEARFPLGFARRCKLDTMESFTPRTKSMDEGFQFQPVGVGQEALLAFTNREFQIERFNHSLTKGLLT